MAFFGSLKNSLKQRWLQYFQSNRFWISLHSGVATPDGGKRPPSYLILGAINALEPQLAELMLPFSKLNPNVDTLIDVLGLNFDPDLMLGNSSQATIDAQKQQTQCNDLLQVNLDDEFVVVVDEAESLGGGSSVPKAFQEQAAFTITSLDEIAFDEMEEFTTTENNSVVNSLDDFGDVFLGEGDEVMVELTSNKVTADEQQEVQGSQDISGLFPNY
ncbi:DUF5331 domain-containing protein [Synechocystis sp. PCC 7509]|uniref:DUF5331 domain-containing protein n=1 Tax=Synechocystis sp. PCC 7509 TaxID=927677 RepID=UPI0002ACBBBC|nr:DUF5331 domain-containing protein [Synechocystis sp. PCC 7509]